MDITLNCAVIDDEPLARELICSFVRKTPYLNLVNSFSSASEAIHTIVNNKLDLVFLDIQMSELNGLELAKIIPENCKIIFVTAFEKYALDSYKLNALDYLLKPVNYTEFLSATNKAMQLAQLRLKAELGNQNSSENNDFIIVKSEYKLIQIDTSKITYIEGLKDYIKIHFEDTDKSVLSLMNMKTIEQSLPANRFIRVHRSFIVQLSKIQVIERNRILFGNQSIPISDTYKKTFNDYLQKHAVVIERDSM